MGFYTLIFLGLQHFEQGFVGFCVLLGTFIIAYILYKDKTYIEFIKKTILAIFFVVLAKLILSLFFSVMNVGINGDRWSYFKNHYQIWVNAWLKWWYLILYSFFGVAWVVILKNFN